MPSNIIPMNQITTQNKDKNKNMLDIENILNRANKISVKKNSNNNIDKKLN